jgi:hypothetical protein
MHGPDIRASRVITESMPGAHSCHFRLIHEQRRLLLCSRRGCRTRIRISQSIIAHRACRENCHLQKYSIAATILYRHGRSAFIGALKKPAPQRFLDFPESFPGDCQAYSAVKLEKGCFREASIRGACD